MKTNTSNDDEHSPCGVDENCNVRRGWYCENCILNKGIMQSYAKAISDVEKIIDKWIERWEYTWGVEELKQEIARLHHSPQLNKPTGFDSSSCLRREHNSRVIGTQNSLGEKSAVSPEDTIQKLGTNVKGQTAPNPADANELRKNIKLLGEWVNLNSAEGEK